MLRLSSHRWDWTGCMEKVRASGCRGQSIEDRQLAIVQLYNWPWPCSSPNRCQWRHRPMRGVRNVNSEIVVTVAASKRPGFRDWGIFRIGLWPLRIVVLFFSLSLSISSSLICGLPPQCLPFGSLTRHFCCWGRFELRKGKSFLASERGRNSSLPESENQQGVPN